MTADSVVGIVLGAGKSSRFGEPKQLLPLGDCTVLGTVVQNANRSALDRVVVVLGRVAEVLRRVVDFGRAEVVENTSFGTGCASSLLAGLDAAGECAAIALVLGDQPGVRGAVIDEVLRQWRVARPWAAVTSYRGQLGHPFFFSREAFGELRLLHGDKAVWKLVEKFPERIAHLPLDLELPPDIDTIEDYEAVLTRWLDSPPPGRDRGSHQVF